MGANFQMGMSLGQGLVGLFSGGGRSSGNFMELDPMSGPMGLQQQSIDMEAQSIEEQGRLALDEAEQRAEQIARRAHDFREEQAVGYSNSGVLIAGTPTEVLNRTVRDATEEITAEMKQGVAQHGLAYQRAAITRNEGRAALLGAQMQYNTRKAQSRIAALEASSQGGIGDALIGLGGALGNYNPKPRGTGYSMFSSKPTVRGVNQYGAGAGLNSIGGSFMGMFNG